jgi:hypothetical protein
VEDFILIVMGPGVCSFVENLGKVAKRALAGEVLLMSDQGWDSLQISALLACL